MMIESNNSKLINELNSQIIKIDRILFCSNQKIPNKDNKTKIRKMLVHEQLRQSEQRNVQQIPCQSTKCKSQNIPTHFTIPQENESKKLAIKAMGNKIKVKKSAQDKQYRKLNKQSKKVKSLEEQYRELEEQIKEVKQMVQLQLQLINHTSSDSAFDNNNNQHSSLSQKVQQIQTTQHNNTNKNDDNTQQSISTKKLQQLINTLFSYQQTIQTANSNYLLLSQVNKQQESQSLFQINSLQDRIRQLRFLLNSKEDLLAYEMATMDSGNLSSNSGNDNIIEDDDDDNKPICIDYHMPKKMTMANQHNMDSEYKLVQRTVVEMGRLRLNVKSLQEQLRAIQNEDKNQNVQQVKNDGRQNQQQQDDKEEQQYYHQQQHDGKKAQTHITPLSLTTRATPQSAISKSNNNHFNHSNNNSNNLQYLPLSTTNYKNSLIYKVGKLNEIQQQKGEQLKQLYKNLMKEYNSQIERKKHLVSEYEIERDIYQYKKRQVMINNVSDRNGSNDKNGKRNKMMLLKQIQEEEMLLQQNEINVENILAELHSQQEEKEKMKVKDLINSNIINNTPTNIITVRQLSSPPQQQPQPQSSSSTTINTNYHTIQSSSSPSSSIQKNSQQQSNNNILHHHQTSTGLFNQITNTPQKQKQTVKNNVNTNNNSSPFLKLKLKSTFYQQKASTSSSSQKINNQHSTLLSRFSLNKYHDDKENPSVVKKLAFHQQQERQKSTPKPKPNPNQSTFNTPTKKRRQYNINIAQSNPIENQFTSIKVQN